MKLTLMLMGGSALLILGIIGIYFGSGATTMNILEIAAMHNIPVEVQKVFFPFVFHRIRRSRSAVPVPHMEPRRSRISAYSCVNASRRRAYEAWRLWLLPHCHVPSA